MSAIRTFNVEAGLPTLDEARRLVIAEINRAKREGAGRRQERALRRRLCSKEGLREKGLQPSAV